MKTCPTCEWIVNELKMAVEYWNHHHVFKVLQPKDIVDDFDRILRLLKKEKEK